MVPGLFWMPLHNGYDTHRLILSLEVRAGLRLKAEDDPNLRGFTTLTLSVEWAWVPCTIGLHSSSVLVSGSNAARRPRAGDPPRGLAPFPPTPCIRVCAASRGARVVPLADQGQSPVLAGWSPRAARQLVVGSMYADSLFRRLGGTEAAVVAPGRATTRARGGSTRCRDPSDALMRECRRDPIRSAEREAAMASHRRSRVAARRGPSGTRRRFRACPRNPARGPRLRA